MNSNNYRSKKIFDLEIKKIFSESHYISHTDFISNNNYLSYFLGEMPLVLRKNQKELNLLSNICLHRSCIIHDEGLGNKSFTCPYHGWKYNDSGDLKFSPLVKLKKKIKLKKYFTHNVNKFIFGSLNKNNRNFLLRKSILNKINISNIFYRSSLVHKGNWKLLVENVLESYHLSFVHKNSFVKNNFNSLSKIHNKYFDYGSTSKIFRNRDKNKSFDMNNFGKYEHYYIFPNLFISITDDAIGFVSSFIPTNHQETKLNFSLFELSRMSKLEKKVKKHFQDSAIEFTNIALNEDKQVIELSQKGLNFSKQRNIYLPSEERIVHFHKIYEKKIK
jgi:phenylpropionate dioxygenase-like ring-hydroxylating dioxygenase large terminal subunit